MKRIIVFFVIQVLFVSCVPQDNLNTDDVLDGIILNQTVFDIVVNDTYQIEAGSMSTITYESENPFCVTVSSDGLITADHVGTTRVILSNGQEIKEMTVNVAAVYDLYPEPNLTFGKLRTEMVEGLGTPDAETAKGIGYVNYSDAAPNVYYIFDDNNKLACTAVDVITTCSSVLASDFIERYMIVSEEDEYFTFVNGYTPEDTALLIVLSLESVYFWRVMCLPYTAGKKSIMSYHIKNYKTKIDTVKGFMQCQNKEKLEDTLL